MFVKRFTNGDDDNEKVFYRPANGWVGDVIPFYDQGEYKLYYLHDERVGGIMATIPHGIWRPLEMGLILRITERFCQMAMRLS